MKIIRLQVVICLFLFLAVSPCHALFDSDVKKAKEFIEVGMTPQAIALLQKRITDKPTDGEAHFLLAQLYVSEGEVGQAEQRFKSSMMIDSDYGYKIGGVYHDAGNKALSTGDYNRANTLFSSAVQYDPKYKNEIGAEYFAAGKRALGTDDKNNADQLLEKALEFDHDTYVLQVNALYQDYGRILLRRAKDNLNNNRSQYVNEATKYLPNSEISEFLVKEYRDNSNNKSVSKDYRNLIKAYTSESKYNELFPPINEKIYDLGTHEIYLKAGKITDHFVVFPRGRNSSFTIGSDDDKFILIFDDGDELKVWVASSIPQKRRWKFRIKAVTDQHLKLVVK